MCDQDDNILSQFLPDMKDLNMEILNLYLMSESIILDDDLIKLTVAPNLSKSQVAINLYQIVKSRHKLTQFLTALKRSSEQNPWHGELHKKISKEREQRRASVSSVKSKVHTLAHDIHAFTKPGELESRGSEYKVSNNEPTTKFETQIQDMHPGESDPHNMNLSAPTDSSTAPLTGTSMETNQYSPSNKTDNTITEEDKCKSKFTMAKKIQYTYKRWGAWSPEVDFFPFLVHIENSAEVEKHVYFPSSRSTSY